MKLQTLLFRENFISIFKKTFSDYLSNNFGWQGDVRWISRSERTESNYFLVNQRLNLIYPCNLNRSFLYPFKNEYVYHKNPIRHAFQMIYVNLSTSFALEWLFSTASIEIEPWVKDTTMFN